MLGWRDEDLRQYAFCRGACETLAAQTRRNANQRLQVYCASLAALTLNYIRNPRLKPLDEREQVDLLGRLRRHCAEALQGIGINPQQASCARDIETAIADFGIVKKPKRYGLLISGRIGPRPDPADCIRYRDSHPGAYQNFVDEARQRVFSGPRQDNIFTALLPRS